MPEAIVNLSGDARADLPVDPDGRLYHLGLRRGDVSNLIVTVGDDIRARSIALMFDNAKLRGTLTSHQDPPEIEGVFSHRSSRGFLTFTGYYQGQPITVMSIGMGYPNMDFFVREIRAIVEGPLVIIRVGTCGVIGNGRIGMLAIPSKGALMVQRNYNFPFNGSPPVGKSSYLVSDVFAPDYGLTALLYDEAIKQVGAENLILGTNASTDSFYSSQGRPSSSFHDANVHLLQDLKELEVETVEMETGHLFHLARCIRVKEADEIRASAIQVVVADRFRNEFLTNINQRTLLDRYAARIALNTLRSLEFDDQLFSQTKVLSSSE